MSFKILQAYYSFDCPRCDHVVMQASLYLQTRGLYSTYEYCKFCATKKGYSLEDFETFRPDVDVLSCPSKYDPDGKLSFDFGSVN